MLPLEENGIYLGDAFYGRPERIHGTSVFRGMTGGRAEGYCKQKRAPLEHISINRLVKHYLCDGENSLCVLYHTCECLDVCRYGQHYLKKIIGKQEGEA